MAQSIMPLSFLVWGLDALRPGARGAGVLSRSARPSFNSACKPKEPVSSPLQGFARFNIVFLQGSVPTPPCTLKSAFVPVSQNPPTSNLSVFAS